MLEKQFSSGCSSLKQRVEEVLPFEILDGIQQDHSQSHCIPVTWGVQLDLLKAAECSWHAPVQVATLQSEQGLGP